RGFHVELVYTLRIRGGGVRHSRSGGRAAGGGPPGGDRESTVLNPRPTEIYTLSLHDALPICGDFTWSWSIPFGSVAVACGIPGPAAERLVADRLEEIGRAPCLTPVPPRSTLFPYTTLFRSAGISRGAGLYPSDPWRWRAAFPVRRQSGWWRTAWR